MNTRTVRLGIAAIASLIIAASAISPTQAAPPPPPQRGSMAIFEGEVIDLSQSWGDAHACLISDSGNICFRTEAERAEFLNSQSRPVGEVGPLASCSNNLYLYDGTNKTGDSLGLSQRGVVISLSLYSFANRTSSYRIGNCNAALRDSTSAVYPGNTSAGASANSMVSGWNNRVTSVVIA